LGKIIFPISKKNLFFNKRKNKDLSTIDCSYVILEIRIIAFVIKKIIIKLAIYKNILDN
jgi:hypothetical protein